MFCPLTFTCQGTCVPWAFKRSWSSVSVPLFLAVVSLYSWQWGPFIPGSGVPLLLGVVSLYFWQWCPFIPGSCVQSFRWSTRLRHLRVKIRNGASRLKQMRPTGAPFFDSAKVTLCSFVKFRFLLDRVHDDWSTNASHYGNSDWVSKETVELERSIKLL